MEFDFYQKLTALCFLRGGCTITSAALALSRLGIVAPDKRQEAAKYLRKLAHDHRVVGGFLVERVRTDDGDTVFFGHSADRSVRITEGFLKECAPDWADQLRATIKTFQVD